jgi:hypothetical protein
MEELAKAQMSTTDIIMGDVKAIKEALTGGVVTSGQVTRETEGARRTLTTFTGAGSELVSSEGTRKQTERALKDLGQLVDDLRDDKVGMTDDIINYLERAGTQLGDIDASVKKSLEEAATKISQNLGDQSMVERLTKEMVDTVKSQFTTEDNIKNQPISSIITGSQTPISGNQNLSTAVAAATTTQTTKIEFTGGARFQVDFSNLPSDLTPAQKEQIIKTFSDQLNTFAAQTFVQNLNKSNNPLGNNATQYFG